MKEYFRSIFKKHMTTLLLYSICYFAGAGIFFQLTQQTLIAYTILVAIGIMTIIITIESYFCAKRKFASDQEIRKRDDTEELYHKLSVLTKFLGKHEHYSEDHIKWEVERYRDLCENYTKQWGEYESCSIIVDSCLSRLADILEFYNLKI